MAHTGTAFKIVELEKSGQADINQLLDLISLFVHDLEGPLVVMQTILRLMDKNRLDLSNKNHIELVSSGKIAMDRARSIIGDLMVISKSDKLGMPVSLKPIAICEYLDNSVNLIRPSANENGVEVVLKCRKEDYTVSADSDLLLRVLDNLLFNALRHSPPDGKIEVSAKALNKQVQVKVKDQGPGFHGFDPSDLFDKFKQLNLRLQGKHRGVGLGLYFCSMAITAMGGKIWAENGPEGGAEFNFTLNIMR